MSSTKRKWKSQVSNAAKDFCFSNTKCVFAEERSTSVIFRWKERETVVPTPSSLTSGNLKWIGFFFSLACLFVLT